MVRLLIILCLLCGGVAAADAAPVFPQGLQTGLEPAGDLRAEPGIEAIPVSEAVSSSLEPSLEGLRRGAPSLRWVRFSAPDQVQAAEVGKLARAQGRITPTWIAVQRPKLPWPK